MSDIEARTLPNGWAVATFEEVTHLQVPQKRPEGASDFQYVDISSIDNHKKKIVSPKLLPVAQAPSRARQELRCGDVLVSMTRPNLNAVAMVPPSFDGAIGSTGFHVLRTDWVESAWLYFLVQSTDFVESMSRIVQGVVYPAVRPKDIRSYVVPLAPLPEQHRIVAEIEKHFTRLDAAVAALKRVRANLKRYRASVLKAACEGRLVPTEAELAQAEGRDYEPADVLLQRILTERRARWEADELAKMQAKGKPPKDDRWKAKYKEPEPPDTSALPELPEGWVIASTDQLTIRITSGSRDWSKYYGTGSGTFLMAQNVRPGKLDLSLRQAVDPPIDDRDRLRSQVLPGDLLVTIVGANTGDVCRVPRELPEHYVCQSVALIRPVYAVLSAFLEIYLVSEEHGQRQYQRHIYGQGRPHLSFEQLRGCVKAISQGPSGGASG